MPLWNKECAELLVSWVHILISYVVQLRVQQDCKITCKHTFLINKELPFLFEGVNSRTMCSSVHQTVNIPCRKSSLVNEQSL
jgi:hypothetical protein